ncbi:MAG TPA: hypothetical protein VF139_11330 [Candidatus Polarisedimenticolaceae bacterium]
MNIKEDLSVLVSGKVKELVLAKLPDDLAALLEHDDPITKKSIVRITDCTVSGDVDPITEIAGLSQSLTVLAEFELDAAFFAPGDTVRVADLEVPWPDQSIAPAVVPADRVICGVELAAALRADASVRGTLDGIAIALRADGKAEIVLRFFKELPKATGARTALLSTFRASKSPFNALTHPPAPGEILVAEFSGGLELGAEIGYGWTVGGSRSFGEDLAGVDLTVEAKAEARVGLSGSVRFQGAHTLVVRPGLQNPDWLNVSFVKTRRSEASLAASVSVDIHLKTGSGADGEAATAEFVDGLLGRTPLPSLMARIRALDPAGDVEELRTKIREATVARLAEALRSGLEPSAVAVDAAYAELFRRAEELVQAYDAFDAKILAFVEQALESSNALSELDAAVDTIDSLARAGELQGILDTKQLAGRTLSDDEVRRIRAVVEWTRKGYGDASPIESWIRNRFSDLKRLVTRYREQREEIQRRIEGAYRRIQNELSISTTVEKIRRVLESKKAEPLQTLLEEKIVWLETHLSTKLNQPVDHLAAVAEKVKAELKKLVDGYDRARATAAEALEKALNRNLMLNASLAWSRLQTNQTLASVDVDPGSDAGRAAYRHLLRGDVAAALGLRRDHPGSIRFWKSYVEESLRRDFTVRTSINGRNRMTIDRFLLSSATQIEATDDGEILVQSVKTGDERIVETRRRLVHVQTLFEVAFEERWVRAEDRLVRDAFELRRSSVGYSFAETLKDTPSVKSFRKGLDEMRRCAGWLLEEESAWEQARASTEEAMRAGAIGEITLRLDASLSPMALASVFDPGRNPGELGNALAAAYVQALGLMPFSPSLPGFVKAHLLDIKQSYVALLLEIHRDVFVQRRPERIPLLVTKLGKFMKDLDVAGKVSGRNFVMTMFTLLTSSQDRGASLRIAYLHPITQRKVETRFDRLPEAG